MAGFIGQATDNWLCRLLFLVLLVVVIGGVLLEFPPHEVRRALQSCIHCGNTREVIVSKKWWNLAQVYCTEKISHPIAEQHVHRWYQYNSKIQTTWSYTGWTRDQYEHGESVWKGDQLPEADSQKQPLSEDWLK